MPETTPGWLFFLAGSTSGALYLHKSTLYEKNSSIFGIYRFGYFLVHRYQNIASRSTRPYLSGRTVIVCMQKGTDSTKLYKRLPSLSKKAYFLSFFEGSGWGVGGWVGGGFLLWCVPPWRWKASQEKSMMLLIPTLYYTLVRCNCVQECYHNNYWESFLLSWREHSQNLCE